MPASIPFEWSETISTISFEFDASGLSAKNCDVFLSENYVKVNCPPRLTEIDLAHSVDYLHAKTRCRFSKGRLHVVLQKIEEGCWNGFKAEGSKEDLKQRREASIKQANESMQKLSEDRASKRLDLLKMGETDQWQLDQKNRETVEKWQKEERQIAEDDIYDSLRKIEDKTEKIVDLDTLDEHEAKEYESIPEAKTPSSKEHIKPTNAEELRSPSKDENTIEVLPPVRSVAVRKTENFAIPFTKHARPGVPARDLPGRAPPHPRGVAPKPEVSEEMDPVWLKDKGDTFLTQGDYLAAHNAYTEALKEYSNARCFANRAVCALYLGNLGQCIEDCNHAISTLRLKLRVPDGQCAPPQDPEDAVLEAALHVRCGVGNLWMGHFARAVECFEAASVGLSQGERRVVEEDKMRIVNASKAFELKTEADLAVRRAGNVAPPVDVYDKALEADGDSGVLFANRCLIKLQNKDWDGAIADGKLALEKLAQWPTARLQPPKLPARPQRLDPPTVIDHTFRPQVRKDEKDTRDWLMKHSGGSEKDLPPLPPEYEWIRDAGEKSDDAWIAVKRKLTKEVVDSMRRNIGLLQDALFSRKVDVIREAVRSARNQNEDGIGPCAAAIRQAEEYVEKLDEFYRLKEEKIIEDEAKYDEEIAHQGRHTSAQCVEKTRRRLYVKVKLRCAAAYEAVANDGQDEYRACAETELNDALNFEPNNADALERLDRLKGAMSPKAVSSACLPQIDRKEEVETEGEQEEGRADCSALAESARGYIAKEDYGGAYQMLSYALRKDQFGDTVEKVKCMSNACLCLQKMRGRVEDLVDMCTRTLDVLSDNRDVDPSLAHIMVRMECACYSRRGWGYQQMGRGQDAERDAEKVQYLLSQETG